MLSHVQVQHTLIPKTCLLEHWFTILDQQGHVYISMYKDKPQKMTQSLVLLYVSSHRQLSLHVLTCEAAPLPCKLRTEMLQRYSIKRTWIVIIQSHSKLTS